MTHCRKLGSIAEGNVFASLTDLKGALVEKAPSEFVSHYIFEPVPFVFAENLTSWIEWKTTLAASLNVDPYNVVMTGSAALGYSLNPNKNFREFDEKSDFDCGIISDYHFTVAWRYLREARARWLGLPSRVKTSIENHRKNYIFAGTIAAESILPLLPFGPEWQSALDAAQARSPADGREVKLRIYRDYDSLRSYQAHNIGKIRESLLSELNSAGSDQIQVETVNVENVGTVLEGRSSLEV